jgi:hypothetical protein
MDNGTKCDTASCDKQCKDHAMNDNRLTILEEKLQIIEDNTKVVDQLTGRVNLLIVLMAITATTVSGGAMYTFTAISRFKQNHAGEQLSIEKQIHELEQTIDKRFDSIEHRLTLIEAQGINKPIQYNVLPRQYDASRNTDHK